MPKLIITIQVPEGFDVPAINAEIEQDIKVSVEQPEMPVAEPVAEPVAAPEPVQEPVTEPA